MIEGFGQALSTEGFAWAAAAAFVAGIVRGFSGFGTAMIYLPIAGLVFSPVWALITLVIMDLVGPLPNMPRALRDGHPRDLARLALGALVALPLGVLLLGAMSPEVFRYGVSTITLLLLVLLFFGVRYTGHPTPSLVFGTGAAGGFLAGCVGLPGPPVVLLYLSGPHSPSVIRGNNMAYLLFVDVLLLAVLGARGLVELQPVLAGILLIPVYLFANVIGGWIFSPGQERLYRSAAYVIIACSAVIGFPFWG